MEIEWGRVLNLVIGVLQGLLSLMFLLLGANKLDPDATSWVEIFAKIGIGQWFRYFTGGLEVVCSVLLLVPETAGAAAGLLSCTMVGAVLTHLLILRDGYAVIFAALPLVILIVVVWKRRVLPHCERKIKQGRFVTCAPRWSRASAELAGRR